MAGRGMEVKDLGGALPVQGHLEQHTDHERAPVAVAEPRHRLGDMLDPGEDVLLVLRRRLV